MSEKREIAYHFTGDKLRDGRDVPAIGNGEVSFGIGAEDR